MDSENADKVFIADELEPEPEQEPEPEPVTTNESKETENDDGSTENVSTEKPSDDSTEENPSDDSRQETPNADDVSTEEKLREAYQKIDSLQKENEEKEIKICQMYEQLKRRDQILASCTLLRTRAENVAVTLEHSPSGCQIYQIQNKEDIPFTIKMERLTPILWEKCTENTVDVLAAPTPTSSSPSSKSTDGSPTVIELENENTKENGEQPEKRNSGKVHHVVFCDLEEPEDEGVGENCSDVEMTFHPSSPSSSQRSCTSTSSSSSSSSTSCNSLSSHSKRRRLRSEVVKVTTKRRSSPSSSPSTRRHPIKQQKIENSINSDTVSKSTKESSKNSRARSKEGNVDGNSISKNYPEINSVLKIPEIHRVNFGCAELWDLSNCPVGLKFWYNEKDSNQRKFFIQLHNDHSNWEKHREFFVLEQDGLALPKVNSYKFIELEKKLQGIKNKKIWLDLRDFNILSKTFTSFIKNVDDSITHFSFGHRLYSTNDTWANTLLEFISHYLPQLEFCSINDEMLSGLDSQSEPKLHKLKRLQTLRLIHSKLKFGISFIIKACRMSPFVENLYGVPLHCLRDLEKKLQNEKVKLSSITIRSVCIWRVYYTSSARKANDFHADLTMLSKMNGKSRMKLAFEDLDTRTFFIHDSRLRVRCQQDMSKIIKMSEDTLIKLTVEPVSSTSSLLGVPRLKNLTTIHFDLTRRCHEGSWTQAGGKGGGGGLWSLFRHSSDLLEKFPKLNTIKISVDKTTGKIMNVSSPQSALDWLEKSLPQDASKKSDALKQIQHLVLTRFIAPGITKGISNLFRNLRILRIDHGLIEIKKTLPSVFKYFDKLHQLIIEVDTNVQFGNLDSSITGISTVICQALKRSDSTMPDEKEIEAVIKMHRKENCICNLKDLRLFKIVLRSSFIRTNNKIPVLTPIAAIYGWHNKKMQKLQVKIAFDERTTTDERRDMISALTPMTSYLTFEH